MLIKISAEGHKFVIPFPLTLCFMFPGAIAKIVKKNANIDISVKQLKSLIEGIRKELKHSKKALKNMPLVDVKSGDGTKVKIFL